MPAPGATPRPDPRAPRPDRALTARRERDATESETGRACGLVRGCMVESGWNAIAPVERKAVDSVAWWCVHRHPHRASVFEDSLNQSITAFTKNYTRPHMTQACTPYKSPATRHHTQSTHQSAEAHTTSIIRDQLLSLVSGLSLTQSTGPRSLSTSSDAFTEARGGRSVGK